MPFLSRRTTPPLGPPTTSPNQPSSDSTLHTQLPHPQLPIQIPQHLFHLLISLYTTHSCTLMASTHSGIMKSTQLASATSAPRMEISLMNKIRTSRSTGSENANRRGLRLQQSSSPSQQPVAGAAEERHGAELNGIANGARGERPHRSLSGPGDELHQARGTAMTKRRERPHDEEGMGRGKPGSSSSKGPESETKSHTRARRRAILDHSSEDEDGEKGDLQVSQHQLMKEKSTPFNDSDIDMQLADVSPEHGGSSLQLSLSNDEFMAAPNQAVVHHLDITNLAERTPPTTSHKSPRIATTFDNHSTKLRRGESEGLETISNLQKNQNMRTKEDIPRIDIVSYMWLGFSIHEAIAAQMGK